jgi:DNA polymerase-2
VRSTIGSYTGNACASPIDYQHYLDRQLAPVADGILHFLANSLGRLTATQLALFPP